MPIYEYQCTLCGHKMDALQKVSDAPLTECPECHKPSLTKQMSATTFQLKGTGWYKTDYNSSKKLTSEDNSTKTEAKSSSKTEESTTKPEAKKEDKPKGSSTAE